MTQLLEVRDLVTTFPTAQGPVRAVDAISFSIAPGETVGLVGESGCGKSVTALSILRLLPPVARILHGQVLFQGQDLMRLNEDQMRGVRGAKISMIFQDPMTSLNPVFRIGDQIAEGLRVHEDCTAEAARARALELLKQVGLPDAEQRLNDYPHQFSGGQRQRIMIAMALACRPSLLIADEPTTALDVTIQGQILDLLKDLKKRYGMAILLISHDLGMISEIADRVLLMYAGTLVESGTVEQVLQQPCHPYAKGLLASLPSFSSGMDHKKRFSTIPGTVPELFALPSGCRFSDRCAYVQPNCRLLEPVCEAAQPGHDVWCWEWKHLGGAQG